MGQKHSRGSAERGLRALQVLQMAWGDLPPSHRGLLESIGAAGFEAVGQSLDTAVDELLTAAGELKSHERRNPMLAMAAGVWVPRLRVVLINFAHPALEGLDETSYERAIAHIAWHVWAHALSLNRATDEDVAAGPMLLNEAPEGISERIRQSGYRRDEFTHELVAECYALLMARRRRGSSSQPNWLSDRIWTLMGRVTGWTE